MYNGIGSKSLCIGIGMKKKRIIILACILAASVIGGAGVYAEFFSNNNENQTTEKEIHGTPPDYYLDPLSGKSFSFYEGMDLSELEAENEKENKNTEEKKYTAENMPTKKQLDVELIEQNPELPSGCETVALAMVLKYYGFDVEKTELADKYLIYSSDQNYVTGFTGSPYNVHGGGCYSPSMSNTANRFLYVNNSSLRASYAIGMDLQKLLVYVANDIPVMAWSTIDLKPVKKAGQEKMFKDVSFCWVSNEHCVVITGYDLDAGTLTINDSISGIKTYSIEEFEAVYNDMWQMAVVIK